jgi:hypothetical protein
MNEFWTKAKDQEEEFRSQINIFRGKNEINFVRVKNYKRLAHNMKIRYSNHILVG